MSSFDLTRKFWRADEIIQLKSSELSQLRQELANQNNNKCPLCNRSFEDVPAALDHKHKLKSEKNGGEMSLGLCRGTLCVYCNSVEGKLLHDLARYGKIRDNSKEGQRAICNWLRKLADYYEQKPLRYIHPSEKEKEPFLQKSEYNKLKKRSMELEIKYPEYPKSKKYTKDIVNWIEKIKKDKKR